MSERVGSTPGGASREPGPLECSKHGAFIALGNRVQPAVPSSGC